MSEVSLYLERSKKVLKDLFDSAAVGQKYDFTITGGYASYELHKIYTVLDKKKHDDWTYSLLLRGEFGGVIYRWIAPRWASSFHKERVTAVTSIPAMVQG